MILFLSHRIPYPPNKGDKIRSFHELKYLSQAGHAIHLVCLADQKTDLDNKPKLTKWCKSVYVEYRSAKEAKIYSLPWLLSRLPLSVPYFYSRGLQKQVDALLEKEDIKAVFCFSSVMGEYILRSKAPRLNEKLLILDYCDLDSDKWRQYSQGSSKPMSWIYSREASLLLRYETRLNDFFDYSVFVSQAEADLFRPWAPRPERIKVIANGVDLDFFSPQSISASKFSRSTQPACQDIFKDPQTERDEISGQNPSEFTLEKRSFSFSGQGRADTEQAFVPNGGSVEQEGPVLLFAGAMNYEANVDGVVWFCNTALPELQRIFPGLRMYIVGSNPVAAVERLAGKNVIVTGYVEDIRRYYKMADVCVVPLRMARGVQNKVLEAMAMATPVITTSRVLQGIKAAPGRDLLIADNAQEFVDQTSRVLNDEGLRSDLAARGRDFVLANYDWPSNLQALQAMLESKPSGEKRPVPARACLHPLFFPFYILLIFASSLWPMEETSAGATATYLINPNLQNFMHLPAFAGFSLLFGDFIRNFSLSRAQMQILPLVLGLGFCALLEWLQFFLPGRYFSLSDMLVNITGLFLGLGVYRIWCSGRSHRQIRLSRSSAL